MNTIKGRRYVVSNRGHAHIYDITQEGDFGTHHGTPHLDNGGNWTDTIYAARLGIAEFTSPEKAQAFAAKFHDKPAMTSDERKAKLKELGW